ncbi:MAG: RIP metalloprotease RseP [Desulfobacter postgatei]|jgi:regulator of sigma E protease|uniref:RIP metalloprotease RseP n=1 Tax=Desulfobacter postgatei TaxID=2293 RepID=UPI0023F4CE46|nr:RIP metalloprotease RseP [Desulfobacter postgatei]MDD4273368.1 RIP metalloprotease RseP [Desulfobacter postgatei]MDX9963090.1 RIP metalloprotease RseP [Desulfobacter postgatei]
MGYSLFAFIIVIGVLVFVHELGHFLVARACGVGVEVFSLGFGPKILKIKRGMTDYCISAIPLGGYVKMTGEEPGAAQVLDEKNRHLSFTHKSVGKRALIAAAGPAFNFFLAIVIFYLLYQTCGMYMGLPQVGQVVENSAAMAAGIKKGDVIKEIDSLPVQSFEQISQIVSKSEGKPLAILLEREGEVRSVMITPQTREEKNLFGETVNRFVIGIIGTGETFHHPLNPLDAAVRAVSDTYGMVKLTLLSVVKMFTGAVSADNLGGPIMIAKMAGDQARAGFENFVWFIALISVNLGIINLLPIPVLDGGHLLFLSIEAVKGSPVSTRVREKMVQFGAAVLMTLMIFVFYNDIVKLFNGGLQ